MQKFGVSKEEAERILNLKNEFEVGDKVKINYEKIMNSKISNGLSERYKSFLEENKDKVFTLNRDEKHKSFFVFDEDSSEVKWLWYGGDLIKVEEGDTNE